jgi:hypothetical protein
MLKIQLNLQQDTITGFSYSFTRALLDRLKELFIAGLIWKRHPWGAPTDVTDLVENICRYLKQQIPSTKWDNIYANFSDDESSWRQFGERQLEEKNKEIKDAIDDGYNFLSTFEKRENGHAGSTIDLNQDLINFIETNFDRSPVAGGWKIRGYQSIINWAKKREGTRTLNDLLNLGNPVRRKVGWEWRNVGKKSFDHIKSEFEKLGIETKNYAFFQ